MFAVQYCWKDITKLNFCNLNWQMPTRKVQKENKEM